MIFVPIISLILYLSFIFYSFYEHQRGNLKIKQVRDDYVPALNLVNENIHLFEKLRDSLKDAVLANESDWLKNTITLKNQIEFNVISLEAYPHIIQKSDLKDFKENFTLYYSSAKGFAEKLILEEGRWLADEKLISNIEHYLNKSTSSLVNLKKNVQLRFKQIIDETSYLLSQLLFWGTIISVVSVLFIIVTMLMISMSTRKSLHLIIDRTKELALGGTDFSKRIIHNKRDEIGNLVYWFNKLSDKLENDYISLKAISITDKLTQLDNRTRTDQFLPDVLTKVNSDNISAVVVIIDIDHFKQVNDSFGHLAGDVILQKVADILKENANNNDYISRWGGEEFLLIWSNINAEDAYKKADALRYTIEQSPFPSVGILTASFGLALLVEGDNSESIISRADKKLYEAKRKGRNCICMDNGSDKTL